MSVLNEVLSSTQPGYERNVAYALERLIGAFGEPAFGSCEIAEFPNRVITHIASTALDPDVRLQLIGDLSSLGWWCSFNLSDEATGQLAHLARRTYYEQTKALPPFRRAPDPLALTSHAVFVGQLIHELHSPTRGAFDYVLALAVDPANRNIDVFHTGPIPPELKVFGEERLGSHAKKVSFVEFHPGDLTAAIGNEPRTYHFWCESAYSIHVSLLALFGPSIMFTCGDSAPVQFADVYWYCQDREYIKTLWNRKGAPEAFSENYCSLRSAPFNKPIPINARSRAEFGFSEEEVILVTVGNRLGVDITESFVDGMGAAVLADSRLRWVIVGQLQEFWIKAFELVLGDRFSHIPFERDLSSLMSVCDIFVNPFRAGGGNTAILAIDAGVPVVTRGDLGDVGAFVAHQHLAMSADEFFDKLSVLVDAPLVRDQWLLEQRDILATRLDQKLFSKELKNLVNIAAQRFKERSPTSLDLVCAQPSHQPMSSTNSELRAARR